MLKQNVASVIPEPDIEATKTQIAITTGIKYFLYITNLVDITTDLKYTIYNANRPNGIPNARNISKTPL